MSEKHGLVWLYHEIKKLDEDDPYDEIVPLIDEFEDLKRDIACKFRSMISHMSTLFGGVKNESH